MYAPAQQRLVYSRDDRARTDYLFDFWTAFGWTLLTFGIYGLYVDYRLIERMREHNRRRLAFLEAANELAWERANAQGVADGPLRSRFERVATDLWVLRNQTADFREPAIWLIIILFSQGIGMFIVYWLLDADLVKHSRAEADAERELIAIFAELGIPIDVPYTPPPKAPHQYAARVVVTIVTCGIYSLWWLYDLMRDANEHFARDAAWEDAVVRAVTLAA